MGERVFDTEEEMDRAFERLEELSFKHMYLKEEVEEKRKELEEAEQELKDFEEDYEGGFV